MFSTQKALFFPLQTTVGAAKCVDHDSLITKINWRTSSEISLRECPAHSVRKRTRRCSFNGFQTLRIASIIFEPVPGKRTRALSENDAGFCRECCRSAVSCKSDIQLHRITIATDRLFKVFFHYYLPISCEKNLYLCFHKLALILIADHFHEVLSAENWKMGF